ncbi:MAG: cupin domain-containing protein [Candidatus Rokubacteria bacterium]|nr:cupin domain-containing protein [Candidatus Rokubacteria bacterium]
MEWIRLRDRARYDDAKMARHRLTGTERCQADLYCLKPGQSQPAHAHADQDKLYLGVEGVGRIRVGGEEQRLEPGVLVLAPAGVEHGLSNPGDAPLVVLAVVVPPPKH